jgi:hypothetical protein
MKKMLILILGILFVISILYGQIWLTLVILPISIYLDKQNLFKDFDEKRKAKITKLKERKSI